MEVIARDGVRLYIDVYRPTDSTEKVPAILSWSPYGKKYSALDMLPMTKWHTCVKRSDLSGFEKFEGLDPAVWCPKGYAIVSVDARGAGHSDGNICVLGSQEAEDGYDVVEAVAKLDWCNGNIGMAGNSYLAISQWFTAAQQPPSLRPIAPWEGLSDLYREQFCRGKALQVLCRPLEIELTYLRRRMVLNAAILISSPKRSYAGILVQASRTSPRCIVAHLP